MRVFSVLLTSLIICTFSASAKRTEFSARNCRMDVVAAVKAGLDVEATHNPCWDAALQQAENKRSMFYRQLSQYDPKLQSAIIEFLEIKAGKKRVSRQVLLSLEEEMKREVIAGRKKPQVFDYDSCRESLETALEGVLLGNRECARGALSRIQTREQSAFKASFEKHDRSTRKMIVATIMKVAKEEQLSGEDKAAIEKILGRQGRAVVAREERSASQTALQQSSLVDRLAKQPCLSSVRAAVVHVVNGDKICADQVRKQLNSPNRRDKFVAEYNKLSSAQRAILRPLFKDVAAGKTITPARRDRVLERLHLNEASSVSMQSMPPSSPSSPAGRDDTGFGHLSDIAANADGIFADDTPAGKGETVDEAQSVERLDRAVASHDSRAVDRAVKEIKVREACDQSLEAALLRIMRGDHKCAEEVWGFVTKTPRKGEKGHDVAVAYIDLPRSERATIKKILQEGQKLGYRRSDEEVKQVIAILKKEDHTRTATVATPSSSDTLHKKKRRARGGGRSASSSHQRGSFV